MRFSLLYPSEWDPNIFLQNRLFLYSSDTSENLLPSIQNSRWVLHRISRVNERRDDVDLRPPIIIAITTAASRDVINRNKRASGRATPWLLRSPVTLRFNIIFCRISRVLKDGIRRNRRHGARINTPPHLGGAAHVILLPRLISRRSSTTDKSPRRRLYSFIGINEPSLGTPRRATQYRYVDTPVRGWSSPLIAVSYWD